MPEDIINAIDNNIVWDFIEPIGKSDIIKIQPFAKTE
jgi:hypothetical protein